jgi:short-subunit dehydrogenase
LVRTEWHRRAGVDMSSVPSYRWLEVDNVIRESLADIARGKVISVPGVQNKALVAAMRIVPRNLRRTASSLIGRARVDA